MTKTIDKPAEIVKLRPRDVKAYLSLERKRRELQREARLLDKEAQEFELVARSEIEANDGEPIKVGDFQIVLAEKAGVVAWKQEYVALCGEAAAVRVALAAPKRKVVEVIV